MVYKHFHTQKNKQLLNDNFEKRIWAQNSTSIGIPKVSAGTGTWGKGGKSQNSTSIGIPKVSATTFGFQVSQPFNVLSSVPKSTK